MFPFPTVFFEWQAPKAGRDVACFKDAILQMASFAAAERDSECIKALDALSHAMRTDKDLRSLRLVRRSQRKVARRTDAEYRRRVQRDLYSRYGQARIFCEMSMVMNRKCLDLISPLAPIHVRAQNIDRVEEALVQAVDRRLENLRNCLKELRFEARCVRELALVESKKDNIEKLTLMRERFVNGESLIKIYIFGKT